MYWQSQSPENCFYTSVLIFFLDTQLQIGNQVPQLNQNSQSQQQHQQATGQQQQQQNLAQQLIAQAIPQRTLLPQNYVAQLGQQVRYHYWTVARPRRVGFVVATITSHPASVIKFLKVLVITAGLGLWKRREKYWKRLPWQFLSEAHIWMVMLNNLIRRLECGKG